MAPDWVAGQRGLYWCGPGRFRASGKPYPRNNSSIATKITTAAA